MFRGPVPLKIKAAQKEAIEKNLSRSIYSYCGIDGHDQSVYRKFKCNNYRKIEHRFINYQEPPRQRIYKINFNNILEQ